MKNLVVKLVAKILIAVILCGILSFTVTSLMPTFGNDVAMGQLENNDVGFVAMETWNYLHNATGWVHALIILGCGVGCGIDVYKFIKQNKGENE